MNSTLILVLLLAFVNCVAADVHYISSIVGSILGLVSDDYISYQILIINFIFYSKIIFTLDVIAAVEILRSGKSTIEKVLWILFIFFFPIIGMIFY